ncbi:rRNA maturation RNase YbeY [Breoghania sp. L-A4]|uniref:rRNA maturation RNase YbeY n=1 Tax=Breoghania sp. L-A4 TaxID=2304600 RepID=UPI000E35FD6C|nr:rRNA maturation RNase YbeY [Breoghania sp. L-A4]AXS39002.1 rRNA maturation RNase YbeY [Breoghania sp. L-A4]
MNDAATCDVIIDVAVEASGWPGADALNARVAQAFAAAVSVGSLRYLPGSELSLLFSDDATVHDLNKKWRDQDKPTNVLSFPGGDESGPVYGPLLGDIVFALETVEREAKEGDKPFENHLSHLIVHGILHLFGYDHQIEEDAERMESLERRILARLQIPDPYEGPFD